jgi:hypothetical protein
MHDGSFHVQSSKVQGMFPKLFNCKAVLPKKVENASDKYTKAMHKSSKRHKKMGKKNVISKTSQKVNDMNDYKSFSHLKNLPTFLNDSLHLKEKIATIDWSLEIKISNSSRFNGSRRLEEDIYSIANPQDLETIDLLRRAFYFNPMNRRIGCNLNRRTEFYSFSEQIPNVFHEIIKTARLRTLNDNYSHRETSEVDYGKDYWNEMIKLVFKSK